MNCEELNEYYELFALDIAEEPERGEIRAHLARNCEVCTAGVRRALETAALIAIDAPAAEPSPQLRRRILASVGAEERSSFWTSAWIMPVAGLAIAALLVVAIYFARESRRYADDAVALRVELQANTARLAEVFAIVSGPQTREASFGGVQPRPPQGKVFLNPNRGVLLIASNLPRTSADKIYEMWLMPKGANPVPAGLFQSQDNGNAIHIRPGTVDVANTAAVAVTVENQAGAAQPTSTPVIVAPIPAAAR